MPKKPQTLTPQQLADLEGRKVIDRIRSLYHLPFGWDVRDIKEVVKEFLTTK